jgi:hypothetical protein
MMLEMMSLININIEMTELRKVTSSSIQQNVRKPSASEVQIEPKETIHIEDHHDSM